MKVAPFEGSAEEWDELLEGMAGATFCHLGGWRVVMQETLGHRLHYLVAEDADGSPCGLLPLVRVRSRLFGDYLVSMPFLNYGGPIGTAAARRALAAAAAREAERMRVDLLELRSREPLSIPSREEPAVGGRGLAPPLRTSYRKLTVLLPLPDSAETLWRNGLRAKVRSQVRRPQKAGMEARFGAGERDGFYEVFARTMRDLGTPVLPRDFFDALAEVFPRQVVFGTVRLGERPVAGGCGFRFGGELEITWAGALREHSRAAPNMLLYWAFMEEAIRSGARTFNFGRCSEGSGTHRFKKQWGGEDHPLPWLQWSKSGRDATPSPGAGKYRMATTLWKRLPLGVTNRLGPLLSRSIP